MPRKWLALMLTSLLLAFGAVAGAEQADYLDDKDINEASADDTMAYHIYIGKRVTDVDVYFAGLEGWQERSHDKAVRLYQRQGRDYIEDVYLYPYPGNAEIVGSYRVSYFTRTKEMADAIFRNTIKNFSYILGRPSVKRGTDSAEWIVSDSLKISVECVEYDQRLPVARNYPYEIAIRRQSGDYSSYFRASLVTP